ncbi:MAG: WxL domain-containing protein [Thermoleophilaceae bacterium]
MKAPCASAVLLAVLLALLLPAPAGAVATIYARPASSDQTGAGASSLTLDAPAGTAVGDTMVMDVDAEGTAAVSPPSGWTTAVYPAAAFAGIYSFVYLRTATASDVGASYTVNLGSSRTAVGRVLGFVGTSSSPLEGNKNNGCLASCTNTHTWLSFTTTAANSMVVGGAFAYKSGASTSLTAPAGTTSLVNLGANSNELVSQSISFTQAAAGATGNKTATMTNTPLWGNTLFGLAPATTGALAWNVAPSVPDFSTLALNGGAQTLNEQMPDFSVDDTTGSAAGWNVTVNGDAAAGKSPVFKRYCPNTTCGSDSGPGYVSGGATLPADSLKLDTTGASWSGGSGTTPAFQCSAGCSVDAGSATKIVSAAANGGLGPWSTSGFSGTSLALSTPTTTRALPASEVYRADVVWSLNSGP